MTGESFNLASGLGKAAVTVVPPLLVALNANSSEAEIFNVMGQLQSLQRIKKSGELEQSYTEKEKLEQHGKPKP